MERVMNPTDAFALFWHGFMITSHSSDSVSDDWAMWCMADCI